MGHKLQGKLAGRIDEQLDLVLDRILHLLEAGWRKVRVVTDHGWLLAPGGLPALPLKKYMTQCRWARCAVIREGHKRACRRLVGFGMRTKRWPTLRAPTVLPPEQSIRMA